MIVIFLIYKICKNCKTNGIQNKRTNLWNEFCTTQTLTLSTSCHVSFSLWLRRTTLIQKVFFFCKLLLRLAYCLNLYCKPSNFTKLTMAPRETRESAKATPKIQRTVSKTKVKASPVPAIKKTAVTRKLVEATPIKGMHYI